MIKIGAVWKREKDNKTFFSGQIDLPVPFIINPGTSILLFKNKSDHEKSPALDVFIAEPIKKQSDNKTSEDKLEEF